MPSLLESWSGLSVRSRSRRLLWATWPAAIEPLEGRTLLTSVVVNSVVDTLFAQGSGMVSLRNAVATANASATPTTITFDPTVFATAQTIILNGSQLQFANTSEPTTITGPAAGVTVSGNYSSTVFDINSLSGIVTVTLSGLTITEGAGWGIYAYQGNFTLTNDTITNNKGVAISSNSGSLTLNNVIVSNNTDTYNNGGGIYTTGTASLTNVTVTGNSNSTEGEGGGISNSGNLTMTNVMVSNNTNPAGWGDTDFGAGIYNDGTATMTNVTVSANTNPGSSGQNAGGGGIYNDTNATLTLINCTISGNTLASTIGAAGFGGGIYNNGNATLINDTIANNTAPGGNATSNAGGGGGIYNGGNGTAVLTNVTISGNSESGGAGTGSGGGGINNAAGATSLTIGNTIVAGDTTGNLGPDVYGGVTSLGHNLVGKTNNSSGWIGSDLTGTTASPLNAKLGSLGNNSGSTQTMLPLTGSPAIDAGSNSLIPAGITTDQRGLARISNGTVDIGAVEVQQISIALAPPAAQTAVVNQSELFNLGSFTQSNATGPFTATVNWGDGSSNSVFSVATAGTIPATAHTYTSGGNETVTETVSDSGNHSSNNATFAVTVTVPVTPVYSNLSISSSIAQGTASAAFGGTIDAGSLIPPATETVAITLNGVTQGAAINSNGNFSTTFNTSSLPASNTPYQVTYAYAGDTSFNSVTDNTTTTLLVMPTNGTQTPVYRLYSQVTKEHLYTADLNEYNTLGTRGWDQEGLAYTDYTGLITIGGVTTEPLYRLYNIPTQQHLWTTDPNEYNTLKNFVGTWSVDGISGYIFPANGNTSTSLAAVPGSEALYRMSWPFNPSADLHLWTTDLNEYDTDAATYGWTKEGVIGYVM